MTPAQGRGNVRVNKMCKLIKTSKQIWVENLAGENVEVIVLENHNKVTIRIKRKERILGSPGTRKSEI